MENKKLNYQFTVFGDFSDISPNNSKTIINLLSLYAYTFINLKQAYTRGK